MRRQPCRRREKKKKKKSPSSNLFQFLLPSTPITKLINLSLVAVFKTPRLSSIFPYGADQRAGRSRWRRIISTAMATRAVTPTTPPTTAPIIAPVLPPAPLDELLKLELALLLLEMGS